MTDHTPSQSEVASILCQMKKECEVIQRLVDISGFSASDNQWALNRRFAILTECQKQLAQQVGQQQAQELSHQVFRALMGKRVHIIVRDEPK